MGQKTITGLQLRAGVWHIDKQIRGYGRLCESTGTSDRQEAEDYLIRRLAGIREERLFGVRQNRTWREAATRFLEEYSHQKSIWLSALYLAQLDPYIGDLYVHEIDDEALQPYIDDRLDLGRAPRTVNIALQRVMRIMNLCARKWRDDQKRPWLDAVPMIEMVTGKSRPPYPLSWAEQAIFFEELPEHLKRMAQYKVNTGCREQEVCKLQWSWEIPVPELETSVFLIPAEFGGRTEESGVKNGEDRLVVLNGAAKSVIEEQRGKDKVWVFPYEGRPLHRMNDTAWRNARERAAMRWRREQGEEPHWGFAHLRVHDLKHTFGRRLRAANVSEEDRRALLGHTNGSVTSHYSAAELAKLIEFADRVSTTETRSPALTILKRRAA